MTTYRAIATAEKQPEAPITAELVEALDSNVKAVAEGDATAPVNQASWHPYDKVTVGDSNNGRFYSFAVDGAVATFVTPDFVDGYEYRVRYTDASCNTAGAINLQVELYRETDATYGSVMVVGATAAAAETISGEVIFPNVRWAVTGQRIDYTSSVTNAVGTVLSVSASRACVRSAQKRTRARFSWSAGNFDAGVFRLDRRRFII